MKYSITLISLLLVCFLASVKCKHCQKGDTRQYLNIEDSVKATLFQFPVNTRWVFKSTTSDMDTVYLGKPVASYDNGTCVHDDCCVTQYVQSATQDLKYIINADGLDKFTKFYFDGGHWLISSGTSFSFSTNYNFTSYYKTSLTVNSTLLNDVGISTQIGPNKGDIYPDIAYWSLSKGLVRYDYQKTDGTYIIYERQNL